MGAGAGRQMRKRLYDVYAMRVLDRACFSPPWLLGSIAAGFLVIIRMRNSRRWLLRFNFYPFGHSLMALTAAGNRTKSSCRLTDSTDESPMTAEVHRHFEVRRRRNPKKAGQEPFMIHIHTTSECVITCPHCRTAKVEIMPSDACQFFYECSGCGALLKRKLGTCCVFCSYGSVPCPPVQAARACEKGMRSSLYA